jgi:site-specific recombinase XerD
MSPKADKRTRTIDVIKILDQYEDEHRTIASDRTMYAMKALKRFFVDRMVFEIDIPLCRQYIAHRMDADVAMSTAARELTTLRAACNHAIKWKRISDYDRPTFEIPTDLPRREIWLFKDELRHLISTGTGRVKSFTKLAYGTGSRRRAIETLEWYQCDLTRRSISLAKRGERKSNKRRPVVPMGELYPLIKELYENRTNDFVLGSDKDILYEFEKTLIQADLLHVEERDGRPAGKITPHVLRHSRATHMLEDGVSIYAVARLLGDNPTTVQRVYGHISMGSLEDEIAKSSL